MCWHGVMCCLLAASGVVCAALSNVLTIAGAEAAIAAAVQRGLQLNFTALNIVVVDRCAVLVPLLVGLAAPAQAGQRSHSACCWISGTVM